MYKTVTVNIMVESVKESIQFYEETLGFQCVVNVPNEKDDFDFAIIAKDTVSIMLQDKESLIEEYPTLHTNSIKPAFTLFITVDDVQQTFEEVKDKVEIIKEVHKTFYGKDEFAIFDNNHNILTISSHG